MPPKKKKGKKKKKAKKDDAELELEDKYKRTMDEIEALKDHLAVRKEIARRSRVTKDGMRLEMEDAKHDLQTSVLDHKAVSADMTRQYKTMQSEMGHRIHLLETELEKTRNQLEQTQGDLKRTIQEKEKITIEKDEEIAILKVKISQMTVAYESASHSTLDSLIEKIDKTKLKWEDTSTLIQAKNKQILLEFGLNPLDI